MPFGSFMATPRDPLPKKEKPAPKPVQPKPVAPKPVPQPPPMTFKDLNSDSTKINVLLIGRTMSQMQEFLCAMNENMSKAMHDEGLAFFTTELATITDVVNKKKKLERFCWEFSGNDWTCANDLEPSKVYTFSISPSGMQEKTLDFVIHCSVYNNETAGMQADAVWYLADGPVLDADLNYDAYRAFLQEALRGVAGAQDGAAAKPVCLLPSHTERYGHFSVSGEQCLLKNPLKDTLFSRCRELFTCGDHAKIAVIPVQVYGGLEYCGTDGEGRPIQRLSQNGYYQTYIPENCQIPGLYTVTQIMEARGTDFFANTPCGGMKKMIRSHYGQKKADVAWQPDQLKEVCQG